METRDVQSAEEALGAVTSSVRLSPVERANLHLINDPALAGVAPGPHEEEAQDAMRRTAPCAVSVLDPALLGREEADVIQVGPAIERIAQGQDGPVASKRVEVHPDNPCFSTDGRALYTKDGAELVRLVVPCESYEVAPGCKRIGPRAFDSCAVLREVGLPEGLESIGRLAFAKTSIVFLDIPEGVIAIEEKACFGCRQLKACLLPESLEQLGGEAFANSGLERVRIPAKVKAWGLLAFAGTPAERQAHRGAIALSRENDTYSLDGEGGLYREDTLVELLSCVPAYAVRPGCTAVGAQALRRDLFIRRVSLPEGVVTIGEGAFQGCRNLEQLDLPESLRWVGDRAFADTALTALRLSRTIEHLGEEALLTQGSSPARRPHLLRSLDLDERNERFYRESGILCERGVGAKGASKALAYVGPDSVVRIPDAVNQLAPYAFFDAAEVDELIVHGHLQSIARGSLTFARAPRVLVVEGAIQNEPIARFSLPSLTARYRDLTDLFSTAEGKTIFRFAYYDAWVTHCGNSDEFVQAAVERLRNPVGMTRDTYEVYEGIFRRKEQQLCALCARRGDLEALEFLLDSGLVGLGAVEAALEEATSQQDAQATACLLEASHRRGPLRGLDLSI